MKNFKLYAFSIVLSFAFLALGLTVATAGSSLDNEISFTQNIDSLFFVKNAEKLKNYLFFIIILFFSIL